MNPNEFIAMVQAMTLENGFDSFIHLKRLRLSCGSDDACDRIMSCIVSIVSLETHTWLSKNNNVVKSYFDSHQLVEIMDINVQDPYVEGTVVFRGQVFHRVCKFGMNEIAMVMASYPKSFQRHRTNNTGAFHMI